MAQTERRRCLGKSGSKKTGPQKQIQKSTGSQSQEIRKRQRQPPEKNQTGRGDDLGPEKDCQCRQPLWNTKKTQGFPDGTGPDIEQNNRSRHRLQHLGLNRASFYRYCRQRKEAEIKTGTEGLITQPAIE